MDWDMIQAKNRLSEVLDRADAEGPQIITRHGRDYAVLSCDAYRELTGAAPNFFDLLVLQGPRFGDDLEQPQRTVRPLRNPEQ